MVSLDGLLFKLGILIVHILIVSSCEQEANLPSFNKANPHTVLVWPVKIHSILKLLLQFHILIVLSTAAEAIELICGI